jgi:hypothetical protein
MAASRYRQIIFAAAILVFGLLQTYGLRYAAADDEASYLDIARLLSSGDWQAAFNGYWGPLYPLLISIGLRLSPDGFPEFLIIQFVNCAIFLVASGAFWWLWRALAPRATAAMDGAAFTICTFSLLRTWQSGNDIATPDVLVAGFAFIVARLLLYIRQHPEYWGGYVGLGVALAFSYFAKAVMFPIGGFVLLIVVAAGWRERRKVIPRTVISAALFIGIASPLVIGISARYQHLTFGETGKLNYAWSVAGVPMYVDWIGDPVGGHPTNPPKLLSASAPVVLSFSGPGTYPPWYEPSYWYRGVNAHATILHQLKATVSAVRKTAHYPQIAVLLALTILAWPYLRETRGYWHLVAFGLAPIVGYCLIWTDERYISGFAVILAACLIACFPAEAAGYRRLGLWLIAGTLSAAVVISAIRTIQTQRGAEQIAAARRVSASGLQPGTRIAIIGNPSLLEPLMNSGFHSKDGRPWGASFYGSMRELWVWIDRLQIVAEIPPEEALFFHNASGDRKSEILRLLSSSGAEAIIAVNHPPVVIPGWKTTDCAGLVIYSPASSRLVIDEANLPATACELRHANHH